MGMKVNELRLAAAMLKIASEKFSNHGCNDVDEKLYEGWTDEERQQLIKDINEWDGDEDGPSDVTYIPDWVLMAYLSDKIKCEILRTYYKRFS